MCPMKASSSHSGRCSFDSMQTNDSHTSDNVFRQKCRKGSDIGYYSSNSNIAESVTFYADETDRKRVCEDRLIEPRVTSPCMPRKTQFDNSTQVTEITGGRLERNDRSIAPNVSISDSAYSDLPVHTRGSNACQQPYPYGPSTGSSGYDCISTTPALTKCQSHVSKNTNWKCLCILTIVNTLLVALLSSGGIVAYSVYTNIPKAPRDNAKADTQMTRYGLKEESQLCFPCLMLQLRGVIDLEGVKHVDFTRVDDDCCVNSTNDLIKIMLKSSKHQYNYNNDPVLI